MCDPVYRATRGEKSPNIVSAATKPIKGESPRSTAVTSCQLDEAVNLQTFRSWIVGFNETSYVRGIIDGGSQRTFIKEVLVTRLGLKILRETCLAVNTFASDAPSRVTKCNVVEVRLRSQFDYNEHVIEAIAMPVICHDIPATAMECSFAAKLRERNYRLADEQTVPRECGEKGISLLIGSDQLWKIVSGDIIRSTEAQGLVAVKTTLGWTLQGPVTKTSFISETSEVMICVLRVQAEESKGLEQNILECFWTLDAMRIAPKEATHRHADTLSVFESKMTKIGKRYQVPVPRKNPDIELLQVNYSVALTRLRNLVKRISKPEGLLERYDTVIRQYIVSGHAEVVLDNESLDGPAYYMPHREVIREESLTTKLLRITAWVQRLVSKVRFKTKEDGAISAEEILAAERYRIRQVQSESFPDERRWLEEKQGLPSNSWVAQLHPFIDESGLLRVGGRLENLRDSWDVKHPFLLPSQHRFTELVFADAHRRVMHGGVTATVHNVRERFWIPRAR
ncbi:uncharacterized protein LOC119405253 [Rhipicephalus sanguineus]|uniref:uncharacterized protein LOC119405253 n=1 Tax=Rhipicephalus sanguineus TaxID=34632 RepID=UPI001894DD0C|nr:uncharacterized protein LOC119405253 [Rhipicephalus sanguineus]